MHIPATPRIIFYAVAFFAASHCAAQSAPPDCMKIEMPDLDDSTLTNEEKIAVLDQALLDMLNQTDPCLPAQSGGGGIEGADGGENGEGGQDGEVGENGDATAAVNSKPVGDVQGDLSDEDLRELNQPEQTVSTDAAETAAAETETRDARAENTVRGTQRSSKLPPDISAAEAANDDIIAEQFRAAAEAETDPRARAKLWNEYRRYKGLPVQPEPDE